MYIIKEGDVNVTVSSKSSGTPSGINAVGLFSCRSQANDSTRSLCFAGFARRQLFNLGVISRGQWFGERPLLTGEKNDFTYTTATRTTVIAIGLKLFSQIRRKVGSTLLRELTAKLEHRYVLFRFSVIH